MEDYLLDEITALLEEWKQDDYRNIKDMTDEKLASTIQEVTGEFLNEDFDKVVRKVREARDKIKI